MVEMRMYLSYPSQKSKITNFCVGVSQIFFWPIFLDVFFDVDSGDKEGFDFRPSGAEISPFFWFWPLHRAILLSRFFKIIKKSSKSPWNIAYFVQNFLLIIFMKFILVHLVPPTHRIAKTAEKSAKIALLGTQISRDWDRNRKIASREARDMLLTSQNHSTNRAYLLHGPNCRASPEPGQKSKITNICVGVSQNFFLTNFFRRIFWRRFR